MATHLQIINSADCLRALVRHSPPFWEKLLTSVITGACIALASARYLPRYAWATLSIVSATATFVAAFKTKRVELRVSNVEFSTGGKARLRMRMAQAVSAAEVRWLEFREAAGSEEQPEPRGLYAVKSRGYVCLLPFVTELEANQIIREIAQKFPNVAAFWRSESPYGTNFLSLGIEKTK
jgi:hypothetical protein